MNSIVVAVFGVSGVGKTTLISDFCAKNPDFERVSASSLLAASPEAQEELRLQSAEKIHETQLLLLEGFMKYKIAGKRKFLIFDGHLVIDNNETLVEIPFDIIAGIKPKGIVVVTASAAQILDNRSLDTKRLRPYRSTSDIDRQQWRTVELAKIYADRLGCVLWEVCSKDTLRFEHAIVNSAM